MRLSCTYSSLHAFFIQFNKDSHDVNVLFLPGYYVVPGHSLMQGETSEILSSTLLPSSDCTVSYSDLLLVPYLNAVQCRLYPC